jgi:hypothetical protein
MNEANDTRSKRARIRDRYNRACTALNNATRGNGIDTIADDHPALVEFRAAKAAL